MLPKNYGRQTGLIASRGGQGGVTWTKYQPMPIASPIGRIQQPVIGGLTWMTGGLLFNVLKRYA
jgi:hypothetical protein